MKILTLIGLSLLSMAAFAGIDGSGLSVIPNGSIPEPGMLALMGIGVAGLIAIRLRKK